jgi:hypothetical protein
VEDIRLKHSIHWGGSSLDVCVSESGNYFYLFATHTLPKSNATLKIPFMDTTGKCIMFFYEIFGDEPATLQVLVYDVRDMTPADIMYYGFYTRILVKSLQ